jgi:hypothetical protein
MILFPKTNYQKFNLGIIVPAHKPYDILSFLCWFSFFKYLPKVKPIIFVAGAPSIDMVAWARKLNFPVVYIRNCFNPTQLTELKIWDDSYAIVISNVFCMRKFKFDQNFDSNFMIMRSNLTKNQNFLIEEIKNNKFCHASFWNLPNNFEEVRYRLINSIGIFPKDKSLNQIKLESIWNDASNIRTLLNQEVRHEEI